MTGPVATRLDLAARVRPRAIDSFCGNLAESDGVVASEGPPRAPRSRAYWRDRIAGVLLSLVARENAMARHVITVARDVLAATRAASDAFRAARTAAGTFVVNVLSSPGSGKTSLLQATARHWAGRFRVAVLVGDLATDRDAQRLAPWVDVVQMTTGGACHLEIPLVEKAFARLPESPWDFLFIENVGNLVCPASHDLGEHWRAVLVSVTEGDDKPAKYPKMFRGSQTLVVSKIDLLPHVPFSVEAVAQDARSIQPDLAVLPVSALHGDGIAAWCEHLESARAERLGISKSVVLP